MTKEYKAKVFKSGNSLALRLPKDLGFREGTTMILREESSKFSFEPAQPEERKIDLTGIWGSCPGLKPLKPEDRVFEEVKRPWDDPDWPGWLDAKA